MEHPICFGPTFIHTSSTTIADNLTDSEIENLTIGSDEESAFKCAIKRCLPGATHVLCTRHLKQNANKQMEDSVGFPISDRQEILTGIFGENGIVRAKDTDTLNIRVERMKRIINQKDVNVQEKKFQPYFENKLLPLLEKHIIEPVKQGKIPPTWTNNNSESANHVLKSAIQWKMQDLPKFIKSLHSIVVSESVERTRSIRDTGNYTLHQNFLHHKINIDHWTNLSDDQRCRREQRFQSDKGRWQSNVVISTDGTRSLLTTPTAGRKPHQTKRKRAERSRTPSAKRRLMSSKDAV